MLDLWPNTTLSLENNNPGGRARHGSRTPRAPWVPPWGPWLAQLGPRGPFPSLGGYFPYSPLRVLWVGGMSEAIELLVHYNSQRNINLFYPRALRA